MGCGDGPRFGNQEIRGETRESTRGGQPLLAKTALRAGVGRRKSRKAGPRDRG